MGIYERRLAACSFSKFDKLGKKKERKELNRCIEIFVDEMEDGCENESTRNERESLRFSDYDCKWRANCTESPRWTPDPY